MSNGEDGQPHITKFEFRSKFFAYCTQAGHLFSFFFINPPTEFFSFPIHVAIGDFHANVYPHLLHSLIVWKHFYSIKKKMLTFSNKKPSRSLGRKLPIKSTLVHLLSNHEQKEQEPQEQCSSITNHLISQSNSDENDALMESVSTQSPLPYHVENEEDDRDMLFSNDDCDSSLDSYDSYQLIPSDHLDDTDEDDDLAQVMFGSLVMEDFSVPFAGNCDESTTPEPTQEYPSHDDDLDLDASEMAMLELLVLCESSGVRHGFYDDLLTLLR
jgi:hypothetical protein